jgi:hypothetical protein
MSNGRGGLAHETDGGNSGGAGRAAPRPAARARSQSDGVRGGQTTLDELVKTKIILVFFMNAETPLYLDGMRHPPE